MTVRGVIMKIGLSKTSFKQLRILGDVILVNLGIILAFAYRFHGSIPIINFKSYIIQIPLIIISSVLIFRFFGLYNTEKKYWSEVFASLLVSIFLKTFIIITFAYMTGNYSFPRTVIILMPFFQLFLLSLWRFFMLYLENKIMPSKKILVIAPIEEAFSLAEKVSNRFDHILGIIVDKPIDCDKGFQTIGTYHQIPKICNQTQPTQIIISGSVPEKYKQITLEQSLKYGLEIFMVPGLYEVMLAQTKLDQINDTLVFRIAPTLYFEKEQFKRVMDLGLALFALLITLPLMLLSAILVKIDSSGPILFRQERVSKKGKRFMLYKFRTMIQNAESKTGPVLAIENDPRITRVGRFLRASRLDELPQLFNIIKGDMSLVGPRPERPYFVEQFEKKIPEYCYRHLVNPGLTGLAQVEGRYSTKVEDKIKYDILYLKKASFFGDLQILLKTIKVLLIKNKAS